MSFLSVRLGEDPFNSTSLIDRPIFYASLEVLNTYNDARKKETSKDCYGLCLFFFSTSFKNNNNNNAIDIKQCTICWFETISFQC